MIRSMTREDVKAVAVIEAAAFSEPWSEKSLEETLEKDEYLYLVAEEEGQVLGYVGVHMVFDEGEITTIAVREDIRDRGIGRSLLQEMKGQCKSRGIAVIYLEVRASNARAIHVYEKEGFVKNGVRKNFYRMPVEDACCMAANL